MYRGPLGPTRPRTEVEWHLDKPGNAGVPAGELGENCGKAPARRRRSQAEHAHLSAIRLKSAPLRQCEAFQVYFQLACWDFHLGDLVAASVLAFASTLASATGAPPWRLLSSAASMKAKISIVSSAVTGDFPVLKKRPTSRQSSS